jgi:hypothetical protein
MLELNQSIFSQENIIEVMHKKNEKNEKQTDDQ